MRIAEVYRNLRMIVGHLVEPTVVALNVIRRPNVGDRQTSNLGCKLQVWVETRAFVGEVQPPPVLGYIEFQISNDIIIVSKFDVVDVVGETR
uniref:Uncharacterized protein n=2 Tax=Rhodococcus TaxID=1827 RepID=Q6XNB2_RHOER|nr:hypothetical protein PBD2.034 [Rhodococcus erythropolis]